MAASSGERVLRKPMVGIASWAREIPGRAAAIPSPVMKSRRFIASSSMDTGGVVSAYYNSLSEGPDMHGRIITNVRCGS